MSLNPDGEDWRIGYDDWKTTAPDVGAGGFEHRPCAVQGCGSRTRTPVGFRCGRGHTPAEMDAAANAARERGWK